MHFKFLQGDKFLKYFQKEKIVIQKVSERHEWNFEVCVVITEGICVPKMDNVGEKL